VDGDELTIEPVNVTTDTNSKNTVHIDENASTIKEIINNDNKKSDVITKKLNGNLNNQGSKTNNVCMKIFLNFFIIQNYFLLYLSIQAS